MPSSTHFSAPFIFIFFFKMSQTEVEKFDDETEGEDVTSIEKLCGTTMKKVMWVIACSVVVAAVAVVLVFVVAKEGKKCYNS